jgi:hypothetical protein
MQNNQPVSSAYLANHRNSKLITVSSILILIGSLFGAATAMADDFRLFGVEVSNDDNLSRAQNGPGKKGSSGISGSYAIGNRKQLSDTSSATRLYKFDAAYYPSYTGYSNASAEAQYTYKKKTGLGPKAWWWSGGGNLGYALYSDGNRSNFYFDGDLSAGRRFGERWEFSAAYVMDVASASESVYSVSGHGPRVSVDFIASERWLVYAAWKNRGGDSWMADVSSPYPGWEKAGPISDKTFGGSAYRVDTTTTETTFGANYVLDDQSSIDFSYLKRDVLVKNTTNWYYNNIYYVSYVRNL